MSELVRTLELIAWDLDSYAFRSAAVDQSDPRRALGTGCGYGPARTICEAETTLLNGSLNEIRERPDLQAEMQGLSWDLGVVDLRGLIAFQRRLSFNPKVQAAAPPVGTDWGSLLRIAFAENPPVSCEQEHSGQTLTLRSPNHNLHLRPTQNPQFPLEVHAGSPFFEVAFYRNRWFLRDGYHRAHSLLCAGVFLMPAALVYARTLEELGATGPRFFSEETLLSARPPMVTDFLDPALTLEYTRPATVTTLRMTWEENIAPAGDMV